jgi:hypothetical protein
MHAAQNMKPDCIIIANWIEKAWARLPLIPSPMPGMVFTFIHLCLNNKNNNKERITIIGSQHNKI